MSKSSERQEVYLDHLENLGQIAKSLNHLIDKSLVEAFVGVDAPVT